MTDAKRPAVAPRQVQPQLKPNPDIKNVIAIASGKGGVGKSTTTINVALALAATGARVGVLDADIHGPSQPTMLGICERPNTLDQKKMEPVMAHGLQTMSIGYLLEGDDTPVIWRGPMATGALLQLYNDTRWDDLDYLLIDLPPGTGDIQLTLAQKIPLSGAVVVTTPQDVALMDVKKAVKMFEKVAVNVIGVVENMAHYHCPKCGHDDPIFGADGARGLCAQYNVSHLGGVPLNTDIRIQADAGRPIVLSSPESAAAKAYHEIAGNLVKAQALQKKDFRSKLANLVIES